MEQQLAGERQSSTDKISQGQKDLEDEVRNVYHDGISG